MLLVDFPKLVIDFSQACNKYPKIMLEDIFALTSRKNNKFKIKVAIK